MGGSYQPTGDHSGYPKFPDSHREKQTVTLLRTPRSVITFRDLQVLDSTSTTHVNHGTIRRSIFLTSFLSISAYSDGDSAASCAAYSFEWLPSFSAPFHREGR